MELNIRYSPLLIVMCKIIGCFCEQNVFCNVSVIGSCKVQEDCRSCLEEDPCCNWCYDEKYNGTRCNFLSNFNDCVGKLERNLFTNVESSRSSDASKKMQIQPQFFNITLRKGEAVNITFTYKPAKDYPLDLYYLGDLSHSMKENLDIFKELGGDLSEKLTQLTKNFRLAYGSFMDKPGMPFYLTAPEKYKQPCENCDQGYLFKHRLNFTKNTTEFADKVMNSKITANLDDLDGALDAIWQILVCSEHIGWNDDSRKIILLATDSLIHIAGDGLLVGAVKRPTEICMLDKNGNHAAPLEYDFPSIGETHRLLREKKVNTIFAVKNRDKREYYDTLVMHALADTAFTKELTDNSSNIIDVITEGYVNFAKQVHFFVNTSQSEYIEVKLFAQCPGSKEFIETPGCSNVCKRVNLKMVCEKVNFKVQLTLTEYPEDKEQDILIIEERNIFEKATLNITWKGHCICRNYKSNVSDTSCVDGIAECGSCYCKEGWTGDADDDYRGCRDTSGAGIGGVCSKNGDCKCAKCVCKHPYKGEYCQYKCPVNGQNICNSKGSCIKGKCICHDGFEGEDCSCSTKTDKCRLTCSGGSCCGRGNCKCNRCICAEGASGNYCEVKNGTNSLCQQYEEQVKNACRYRLEDDSIENKSLAELLVIFDPDNQKDYSCDSILRENDTLCTVKYQYPIITSDGEEIRVQLNCPSAASVYFATGGIAIFAAIIIGGIIFLIAWKINMIRMEKAEYNKFIQMSQNNALEMNPLYKNPNRRYENPMRKSNIYSE